MNRLIILRMLSAAALGLCWNDSYYFLAFAALFPVIWFWSSSRGEAFILAFIYFSSSSRGLAQGAAQFYESGLLLGCLIWAAGNLLLALIYGLLWSRGTGRRQIGGALALLLTALPPIGAVGWAHPVLSAGALFPGWGIAGILATLCFMNLFMRFPKTLVLLSPGLMAFAAVEKDNKDNNILSGTTTHFRYEMKRDLLADFYRQQDLVRLVKKSEKNVVLLPELSGGIWTEATKELWADSLPANKSSLLGVELYGEGGKYNAIVNSSTGEVHYRQRQPIPLSMWKPWSEQSFRADWFKGSVSLVRGKKISFLICYESLLVWPVLHSLSQKPDLLAITGNYWWAKDTSVPGIMISVAKSWSRLFGTPLVMGINL